MNKYEKCATSLMQLGDKIIAEKKHRKAIIMRSTALSLGAAAIIGLGICANALKPPKKPTAENSVYITETTAAASDTPETNAPSPTEQEKTDIKPVQTSKTEETKASTVTVSNAIVRTSTVASGSKAAATVRTSASVQTSITKTSSCNTTTLRTTVSKTETYQTSVQTTAEKTSTTARTTTGFGTKAPLITTQKTITSAVSTTSPYIRTSTAGIRTTTIPIITNTTTTAHSFSYEDMLTENFRIIEFSTRTVLVRSNEDYLGSTDQVAAFQQELTLTPKYFTDVLPVRITAQVYEIRDVDSAYTVAVKFQGSEKYWVYNVVNAQI